MLLHNPGKPLTTPHWFMLELRSERTSEETIKRLGKAVTTLFKGEEVEVFIPVVNRDLDTFVLMTECYIFVRADDVTKVAKLRRVTGVQGVMSQDGSTRSNKFLKVENDYVQGLIRTCLEHHLRRAQGLTPGSWVRLLDGQCKGYCGTVLTIAEGRALVRIEKKTKIIHQDTSVHNLLDMSHIPEGHRVFYYCSTVKHFLEEAGTEAEEALRPDLKFDEAELKAFLACEEPNTVVEPTDGATLKEHSSREQTPTRFAESLLKGDETRIGVILAKTVEAIRSGAISAPKNATILWHVLREKVVAFHREKHNTPRQTYRSIEHIYGKLTPTMVHEAIPELPLRVNHSTPKKRPKKAAPKTGLVISAATTVTEVIRQELAKGHYNLAGMVPAIERAIQAGLVRPPKHLESLARTIRFQVLRHFRPSYPTVTIGELVEMHGEAIRLSPTDLAAQFPTLAGTLATHQPTTPILSTRSVVHVGDVTAIIRENRPQPAVPLSRKVTVRL